MALTPVEGDIDLSRAFDLALEAGADGPGDINLDWGALEPAPGVYVDPGGVLAWARAALDGLPAVQLTIAPIQTSYVTVPPDLVDRGWTDPGLIERLGAAMAFVASELEGVRVRTVAIGNEVDMLLRANDAAWRGYAELFEASAAHARALWPEAEIGVKLTAQAIVQGEEHRAGRLIALSDAVLATVYLDNPAPHPPFPGALGELFEGLVSAAGGRPVHIVEIGHPSSSALGSSEMVQASFVGAAFEAWDARRHEIASMTFVWLHDLSSDDLSSLIELYGIYDPTFREWLGSLGLRTSAGFDKPAFTRFRAEVAARR